MTNLAIALMMALQIALPGISQDRLRVVSNDMVSVVEEEFSNSSLKSSITRDEALPMLAAVAVGESALRADIENCKTTGDGGKSVGLGQVMRGPNWKGFSRKEICGSRRLQLKLSLHVIDMCWLRTPTPDAAFRCYTAGDHTKHSYAARKEYKEYTSVKKSINASMVNQGIRACCATSTASLYIREQLSCEM